MKRRNFLKALGLSLAGGVVATRETVSAQDAEPLPPSVKAEDEGPVTLSSAFCMHCGEPAMATRVTSYFTTENEVEESNRLRKHTRTRERETQQVAPICERCRYREFKGLVLPGGRERELLE